MLVIHRPNYDTYVLYLWSCVCYFCARTLYMIECCRNLGGLGCKTVGFTMEKLGFTSKKCGVYSGIKLMEFSLSLFLFLPLSIWCLCGKPNATNLACGHGLTCFQLDGWDRPDMFLISCSFGCSSNVIHKYVLNVLGILPGVCYNRSPSNLKFPSLGLMNSRHLDELDGFSDPSLLAALGCLGDAWRI